MPSESVFFFLPTENCPELPPVGYSIFVAKKVEGQILGTYFCIKGYHLVGEKTFICNASGEWNTPTPTPTCQCELKFCFFVYLVISLRSYTSYLLQAPLKLYKTKILNFWELIFKATQGGTSLTRYMVSSSSVLI